MILKEFQDAYVLDKPAGVSTHTPDAGITEGFLEIAVKLLKEPLWAVHRLDRDTSGCLLVTKTAPAIKKWTNHLAQGKKKYVFISHVESKQSVWSIEARIEKVASHLFGIVEGPPNSLTVFAKLGKCGLGFLYEAEISTGKTHQIRLHARKSGLPILGDSLYGEKPFPRLLLHAKELEIDGEKIFSPLPKIFEAQDHQPFSFYQFLVSIDRRRFLQDHFHNQTNAWRLMHREWAKKGEPKIAIEQLGECVQYLNYDSRPLSPKYIELTNTVLGSKHWFIRSMLNRGKTKQEGPEALNIEEASPGMPLQWTVQENKMKFDLRHNHGMSSGLFLDQRENRKRLLHSSQGKTVANFFSYTCGFSVAAALGGARESVSIDISPVYLEWGKNNFLLNGLEPGKYEFFTADAQFFLTACLKRQRKFDTIIFDPPTFSRHKGRVFKLSENLEDLLKLGFQCLNKEGSLLVTVNDESVSSKELARKIEISAQAVIPEKILKIQKCSFPYDFEFPLERETTTKGFWVTTEI